MDEANPVVLQASNTWHIVEDSRRSTTALCGQVITHRGAHARLSVVGHEHTCPNCIRIYEEMNPSNRDDKPKSSGDINISDVSNSEINVGQAITGHVGGDVVGGDRIGGDKIGRDKISIGQQIVNFFTGTPAQQRDLRNRQIMLQRVHDFWVKGVLENSLHNEVLIELGMETKPEAVDYPWEMVIQRPDQPNSTLSHGTKMIDVFDELGGSLLILGEPGSGKTMLLLNLARDLITRAEQDPTLPISVVFNLSSWTSKRQPITEWLMNELQTKYSIPKNVAEPWVENDELLLLLDGLDEVAEEQREECVEAINEFRQSHMALLVVCSRIAGYEALSNKLKLQGATRLQPLTPLQVDTYLDQVGPKLATVRARLQHDLKLQELAQSPLMLSVMTLIDLEIPVDESQLLDSDAAYRSLLFETYVKVVFKRRGTGKNYSQEETLHWLNHLVQKMWRIPDVFLIEVFIQPFSSFTCRQRWVYYLSSRMITGLITGLVFGLVYGLTIELTSGLIFGLFIGVALGFVNIVGGIFFRHEIDIVPVERWGWSWWLVRSPEVIGKTTIPNQAIWLSLRNAAVYGFLAELFGLILGLIAWLGGMPFVDALRASLVIGAFPMVIMLNTTGAEFVRHFTLRFILWRNGYLPWNLAPFLDYCVDCIFLRKVGGGYIFIHRYLMEHFASLTEEDIERLATEIEAGRT